MRFRLYKAFCLATVLTKVADASALDCPSVKDLHTDSTNYLTSNGFPKRGSTKQDCTFTLKLNFGSYVKVMPEVVDIPCGGGNGLRFYDRVNIEDPGTQVPTGNLAPRKPSEFQSPLYCGKTVRVPAFVSTNVEMLIHYKAPPGSRLKIGYKAVRSSKGPKVPRIASTRDDAVQELNKWKSQLKKMQTEKIRNYAAGGGGKPENGPKENWSVSAPEWKPPGNNPVQLKNNNRPGQNSYDDQPANNNFGARYNYNYNYNSYGNNAGSRQTNRGGFGRHNEPNLNNHGPYEPKDDYGIYDFESFDEKESPKSGLGGSTKAALVILFLLVISGGSLVYYNERYLPEKTRKQEEALSYLQKRHSNPTSTNATAPGESTVATTTRTEATNDQDPPPSFEEIETEVERAPNKPN